MHSSHLVFEHFLRLLSKDLLLLLMLCVSRSALLCIRLILRLLGILVPLLGLLLFLKHCLLEHLLLFLVFPHPAQRFIFPLLLILYLLPGQFLEILPLRHFILLCIQRLLPLQMLVLLVLALVDLGMLVCFFL